MQQQELIRRLAEIVLFIKRNHPVRVGIDGVDAAGKTTLADSLAAYLKAQDKPIIRASVDSFHNPKSIRYQKGRNSPEGYYEDSFNNQAIIDNLLSPLGESGGLKHKKTIFDSKTNQKVAAPTETAKADSILIMDGVFLFRPELIRYWDLKIFLEVNFEKVIVRAKNRDGSAQEILDRYRRRYIPGQQLYLRDAKPAEKADLVIDNNDFENPTIKRFDSI